MLPSIVGLILATVLATSAANNDPKAAVNFTLAHFAANSSPTTASAAIATIRPNLTVDPDEQFDRYALRVKRGAVDRYETIDEMIASLRKRPALFAESFYEAEMHLEYSMRTFRDDVWLAVRMQMQWPDFPCPVLDTPFAAMIFGNFSYSTRRFYKTIADVSQLPRGPRASRYEYEYFRRSLNRLWPETHTIWAPDNWVGARTFFDMPDAMGELIVALLGLLLVLRVFIIYFDEGDEDDDFTRYWRLMIKVVHRQSVLERELHRDLATIEELDEDNEAVE